MGTGTGRLTLQSEQGVRYVGVTGAQGEVGIRVGSEAGELSTGDSGEPGVCAQGPAHSRPLTLNRNAH